MITNNYKEEDIIWETLVGYENNVYYLKECNYVSLKCIIQEEIGDIKTRKEVSCYKLERIGEVGFIPIRSRTPGIVELVGVKSRNFNRSIF